MDADALPLNSYLDEWLTLLRTRVRPSTHACYRRMLDAYVRPHIGGKDLAGLTTRQLDRLYVDLLTGGGRYGGRLSPRTVAHTHAVLHKALADAVAHGLLGENVAGGAHVPKYDPDAEYRPDRQQYWDANETRRFLDVTADDPLQVLWRVALATGMRRAELLGLRWCDVDVPAGQIRVSTALTEVDGKVRLGQTKTGRPRTLSLDTATQQQLATLPQITDTEGYGLVFVRADGSPWPPPQISDRWRSQWPRLARLGVPRISLHATRHVHATLLLEQGVPIKVVSERLGHTTTAMTMDISAITRPAVDGS